MKQSRLNHWLLLVLLSILMFNTTTFAALSLVIEDNSQAYDPNEIWISFDNGGGATPFDVTYNAVGGGQQSVTIGQNGSGNPNFLSNPIQLSTVTDSTFTVNTVSGVAIFLSYGAPFTTLDAAPSFFQGAVSSNITYQNFELTMTGGAGDQGNLTNINYFTAPMSIKSYSNSYNGGTTPLQSVGFHQNTAQITSRLAALSNSNAVVEDGQLRRYVGPSTWPTDAPYPSFANYLSSIYNNGGTQVHNTIEYTNAFLTNDGTKNYAFTFSLTSAIQSDNSIVLTGNITTMINDVPGSPYPGPTYSNANITISGSDMSVLNSIIYGQTSAPDALSSAVTWGQGWTDWAAFVQNPANNLTNSFPVDTPLDQLTLSMTAIGEITSSILMGFLGNTTVINGTALNDMPSYEWWQINPLEAFDAIQSNPDYYNQWADVIYDASANGVYSIPYTDRLGQGPLVDSVQYSIDGSTYNVDTWVVGFGDPVPEPCTVSILLMGGIIAIRRARRN